MNAAEWTNDLPASLFTMMCAAPATDQNPVAAANLRAKAALGRNAITHPRTPPPGGDGP